MSLTRDKGRQLTEVGHGVDAGAAALLPEDADGGEGDQQEDGHGHRQAHQQREVRLQDLGA